MTAEEILKEMEHMLQTYHGCDWCCGGGDYLWSKLKKEAAVEMPGFCEFFLSSPPGRGPSNFRREYMDYVDSLKCISIEDFKTMSQIKSEIIKNEDDLERRIECLPRQQIYNDEYVIYLREEISAGKEIIDSQLSKLKV